MRFPPWTGQTVTNTTTATAAKLLGDSRKSPANPLARVPRGWQWARRAFLLWLITATAEKAVPQTLSDFVCSPTQASVTYDLALHTEPTLDNRPSRPAVSPANLPLPHPPRSETFRVGLMLSPVGQ